MKRHSGFQQAMWATLVVLLLALGSTARAQDYVTVQVDPTGIFAWNFTIHNNNTNRLSINRIGFKIQTPGVKFMGSGAYAPSNWNWQPFENDTNAFLIISTGNSVNVGGTTSGFEFSLEQSTVTIDQPVTIQWTTYNNTTALNTGTLSLIPTGFQTRTLLDTGWVVSVTNLGPDPVFNFGFKNRSDQNPSPIHGLAFQILDYTSGTIRPSYVQAPVGWHVDSVTASTVYYSATNDLDVDQTITGFAFAMRANPAFSKFNFVWFAYDGSWALMDRDTIRNVSATPGQSTFPSSDTVVGVNQTSCLYNFTVKNYHASNATPPGKIGVVRFNVTTPGVTISSITNNPQNWAKAVDKTNDTAVFIAASVNDQLPGGIVWNTFGISFNNPSGNSFTVHWQTMASLTQPISSGDLTLQCSQAQAVNDTAVISPGPSTCRYSLHVTNRHNSPPSNLYAIGLAIAANEGSFATDPASSMNWTISQPTAQSIRFQVPTGTTDYMTTGQSQDLLFTIIPKVAGQDVHIIWSTYEQGASSPLFSGTVTANCTQIIRTCDTVFLIPDNSRACFYQLAVRNSHTGTAPVTSIRIAVQNGWTIDSVKPQLGWDQTVDASKTSATFSSPTGIGSGITLGGFFVGFKGTNTPNQFGITITTTDADTKTCDTSMSLTCTAGVRNLEEGARALNAIVQPNPMHSSATLSFTLPDRDMVSVTVMDLLGQVKMVPVNRRYDAGRYDEHFDVSTLPSGTYYLRIETSNARVTRKLVIEH